MKIEIEFSVFQLEISAAPLLPVGSISILFYFKHIIINVYIINTIIKYAEESDETVGKKSL